MYVTIGFTFRQVLIINTTAASIFLNQKRRRRRSRWPSYLAYSNADVATTSLFLPHYHHFCTTSTPRIRSHHGAAGAASGEILAVFRLRHRRRWTRPSSLLLVDWGHKQCTQKASRSLAQWRYVPTHTLIFLILKLNYPNLCFLLISQVSYTFLN